MRSYEQALVILQEVGNRVVAGVTLNNIGLVYSNQSRYEEALRYYEQALAVHQEVDNRPEEGITLLNIGAAFEKQQRYMESLSFFEQAYTIFEALSLSANSDSVKGWITDALNGIRDNSSPTEYQQQCRTTAQTTNIPLTDLCAE